MGIYLKLNNQPSDIIDNAMVQIEKENASLKGVLPKNYARDKTRLGELIDLFSFNVGNLKKQEQKMYLEDE